MSGPPPAKRLRQATLTESFSFSRRKSSDSHLSGDIAMMDEKRIEKSNSTTDDKDEVTARPTMVNSETSLPSTSDAHLTSKDSLSQSPDLFSDNSEDFPPDIDCESMEAGMVNQMAASPEPELDPKEHCTFGSPLADMKRSSQCSAPLSPIKPSSSHRVLVKLPVKTGVVPQPFPETYRDTWDAYHVKMPCSGKSLYPGTDKGQKVLQDRWELIQLALKSDILTTYSLEEYILAFNSRYSDKWNFGGLHNLFKKFEVEEIDAFFEDTLPAMVNLALQIPDICTQAVPLLKKQKNLSVTLSQKQVACLLANAFFCTFPRRNARGKQSEYSSFPDINFNQLFANWNKAEKLKCILHYFRRITKEMPTGTVTFQRQSLQDFPNWNKSKAQLCNLHVTSAGTIEDDGNGMLQVDFANKFLGGGVLGHGCVQEEIRFLICPEMIVSRLITEVLDDNECLIMTGCEQFSSYKGYADTFSWNGDHIDTTPRDEWGRRQVEVVAMDALMIHNYKEQFKAFSVRRELNKAYCGFYSARSNPLPAVATGNWGCGAFGGEAQLKVLIQLMAASEARRDLVYFTFNDAQLAREINEMYSFIKSMEHCVGDLWQLINQYWQDCCVNRGRPSQSLYNYICESKEGEKMQGSSSKSTEVTRPPSPDWAAETP